ncbi:MAG: prephenate dehydrogenase/arogenate dehydrogenase family protein [Rhodocyclaceae bacterium]|nr:prephenate dehydrogenase/arogenate dehydrogenase family protein [Rhodocyclaceae bacterium]MBP6108854.1 prephenate dehydrogenase/arogenate dehydrogenase family protein [Rhodocyclaceae bacterium]MBP6279202.1 prephenate dehydrogenase/arogenate dehydrogenase family protein [Rhodocyclaceae bacterium]
MSKQFSRVVIAGVGLIGGSFALALKTVGVVNQVVGIGRTRAALDNAKRLGVIDIVAENWADALRDTDLVLLAMPVGQMENSLRELMPHLESKTLITDAGSTKSDVVAAARATLGDKIGQFIPAHPIAGAEKSGVNAATATLFKDRRVVVTPLIENSHSDVEVIRQVWQQSGARVSELTPETHDQIFAAVSHLPHLLAFALVDEFASRENADELFAFAAGGFRDFTRIASSHPEMWRDICVANRGALLAELDAYMAHLMRARVLLASADASGLEAMFTAARKRRDEWIGLAPSANE